ncbi:MAG: glycine C-acetyltransferase [Planctomycetes bacterium]|nr:glycine C-acetyltransferase [Planctomycetota bacterium]
MFGTMKEDLAAEIANLREAGLYKEERVITTPQGAAITVRGGQEVINFCANNYLGLSSHPEVIKAAHEGLDRWGYGMSSVRFICGTQEIHKDLERKVADFFGMEDAILYAACFDANGGVFEPLLDKDGAIISDSLNHASIIDGVRLCKAQRYRYANNDMADLEAKLIEAKGAKYRIIVTDGSFSMDGNIAQLDKIVELAKKHHALTMVDECHSTGFLGKTGRGTPEHCGVHGQIDIITGTFGKALGGASGGFTCSHREIVELLRQRSRPYLFSNTMAPSITAASCRVLDLLTETTELRDKLMGNAKYFREAMTKAGFDIKPGVHPIVPIMFSKFENDAKLSQDFARDLLEEGIYVIGFYYPVVPKGQSRIRVQLSAAHQREHLDKAIGAFVKIGKKYKVI